MTTFTHTGAEWLMQTEIEIGDFMRDEYERRFEDAEREAFHAAQVEAFCLDGNGHEIEYTEGEFVPASETNTGVAITTPASAECSRCGTVLG